MKRIVIAALAVLLTAALLSACAGTKVDLDPEEINSVTATDALYSSYLYVVEEPAAVREIVEMIAAVTYTEADDAALDLTGTLYSLSLYSGNQVYSFAISPDGLISIDGDIEHIYRITNGFDCDRLQTLLTENDVTASSN